MKDQDREAVRADRWWGQGLTHLEETAPGRLRALKAQGSAALAEHLDNLVDRAQAAGSRMLKAGASQEEIEERVVSQVVAPEEDYNREDPPLSKEEENWVAEFRRNHGW
jgi:hypothetical protein